MVAGARSLKGRGGLNCLYLRNKRDRCVYRRVRVVYQLAVTAMQMHKSPLPCARGLRERLCSKTLRSIKGAVDVVHLVVSFVHDFFFFAAW